MTSFCVSSVDDREALGERMDTLIDTKDKERKKFGKLCLVCPVISGCLG